MIKLDYDKLTQAVTDLYSNEVITEDQHDAFMLKIKDLDAKADFASFCAYHQTI